MKYKGSCHCGGIAFEAESFPVKRFNGRAR